jgi:hypothetical protein
VVGATRAVARRLGSVVSAQVAAEDGLVHLNVALVPRGLPAGEPAIEGNVVHQVEGCEAIAGPAIGLVDSLSHPDLDRAFLGEHDGVVQSVLKVAVRVDPGGVGAGVGVYEKDRLGLHSRTQQEYQERTRYPQSPTDGPADA